MRTSTHVFLGFILVAMANANGHFFLSCLAGGYFGYMLTLLLSGKRYHSN